MASQGLLVLTAVLIQLTFYREIKLGPLLGMTKRPYWEIIYDRPPEIPEFIGKKDCRPGSGMPACHFLKMRSARLNLVGTAGHTVGKMVCVQHFMVHCWSMDYT